MHLAWTSPAKFHKNDIISSGWAVDIVSNVDVQKPGDSRVCNGGIREKVGDFMYPAVHGAGSKKVIYFIDSYGRKSAPLETRTYVISNFSERWINWRGCARTRLKSAKVLNPPPRSPKKSNQKRIEHWDDDRKYCPRQKHKPIQDERPLTGTCKLIWVRHCPAGLETIASAPNDE